MDASLMSWAKAADWPVLAAGNPEGFEHRISVVIYRVNGDVSLTLLAKKLSRCASQFILERVSRWDSLCKFANGHWFNHRPERNWLMSDESQENLRRLDSLWKVLGAKF